MGKDLYYTILQFFEQRMAEHSAVATCEMMPSNEEFMYRVRRSNFGDEVRIWLLDEYHFSDMDFHNRPPELRAGDFILIARPEAGGGASADLIRQYRIGVGKIGVLMGALNRHEMWTYDPPDKDERARRRERRRWGSR